MSLDRDFRFACPRWHLYTPESRRAHEILFGVQSSSSRGRHLSPRRCCMKPLAGEVVWPALLLTLCSQWLQPPDGAR